MSEVERAANGEATAEFLRLCLCARRDSAARDAAQRLLLGGDLNWDAVCAAAERERIGPLLYRVLREQPAISAPALRTLQDSYRRTSLRNLTLFGELTGVLHGLAADHVPIVVLKGAALAEAVYHNLALRPLHDIDVLIRPDGLPVLLRVLASRGFARADVETRTGTAAVHENELSLCKPGPPEIRIELHRSLFDSPSYQHALDMEWFWRTAVPLRIGDAPALMFGPEAQLLHLCGHLVLHHSGNELLWLCDIAEAIAAYQTQLDWELLLDRAQAYHLAHSVQQTLERVASQWSAPVPARVRQSLQALRPSPEETRAFTGLTAAHPPLAQQFWADLASLPGWRQRLRFTWANLFPPHAYMRQRYRIRHPLLLPLYYPYRWLRGLRSAL